MLITLNIAIFGSGDFGLTVLFVLGSVDAWIFGHLIGAATRLRHVEKQFKLISWFYASQGAGDLVL